MKSQKLSELLSTLSAKHGACGIKAEYENEGTTELEMHWLKDIAKSIELTLKIGGVEAISDIKRAINIGVDTIVAPMAESAFAVSKFSLAIKKYLSHTDVKTAINVETITAYNNLQDIIAECLKGGIGGVTVGRVDLLASMGLDRTLAQSERMMQICSDIFIQAKEAGLSTTLGGAISKQSIDFIRELCDKSLLDKFETRKIVFKAGAQKDIASALDTALEFELCWLELKSNSYASMAQEDKERIKMLQARRGE